MVNRGKLTFSPRLLSEVPDFPHMIAPPILSFGRAKVLNVCSKSNTNNYKNKICFYYKQLQINISILHLNSPDINAKTSSILLRRNSNTCQALKMFTVNDKEIKYQGVGTYKLIVYHFRVLISLHHYVEGQERRSQMMHYIGILRQPALTREIGETQKNTRKDFT